MTVAVVGAAKAGKTLFCINFAEYLGARSLCYIEQGICGRGRGVVLPDAARELMVDPGPRCNGVARTFAVNLPHRRFHPRRIALVDTVSLKEKTPLPRRERTKLVLTLQALLEADIVLNLVDLACTDPVRAVFAFETNRRMAGYCSQNGKPYLAVGTKQDRQNGSALHHKQFFSPNGNLLATSSVTREGFPQLRRLLLDKCGQPGG